MSLNITALKNFLLFCKLIEQTIIYLYNSYTANGINKLNCFNLDILILICLRYLKKY